MAGTIFESSHLPIRLWSRAIWQIMSQKNGISALGLQRVLGWTITDFPGHKRSVHIADESAIGVAAAHVWRPYDHRIHPQLAGFTARSMLFKGQEGWPEPDRMVPLLMFDSIMRPSATASRQGILYASLQMRIARTAEIVMPTPRTTRHPPPVTILPIFCWRPLLVNGMPMDRDILLLAAEIPTNLRQENPPQFMSAPFYGLPIKAMLCSWYGK